MPSIFIFAHGGRGAGTSRGTKIVPPGVNVRFFELDEQYLYVQAGLAIANELLKPAPDFNAVHALVQETKTEWETVPDYHASGDNSQQGMGVYIVSGTRQLVIRQGQEFWLSDIIHDHASGGGDVYWLACRDTPGAINVFQATANIKNLNAKRVRPVSGKKPSQVKGKASWL